MGAARVGAPLAGALLWAALGTGCATEAGPSLVLSSDTVVFDDFGASIPPVMLQVTSTGGALGWTATSNLPWVVLIPESGSTPGDVFVLVRPDSLGGGLHTATVTFSASGASDVRLPVLMTIPDLDHDWTGLVSGGGLGITLSLTETGGAVSGTGAFIGTNVVPFDVNGTHRHPAISLTFTNPCCQPVVLDAFFVTPKQINGVITGPGFPGTSVTIDRP